MPSLENTKLLHAHLRNLLAHGRADAFDIDNWFRTGGTILGSLRDLTSVGGVAQEAMREPWDVPCGTACCVAGWAQAIGARTDAEKGVPAEEFAERWLDLDGDEAADLFYGDFPSPSGGGSPDLSDTVAELGRMIAQMEEEDAACAA